MTCQEFRKKFQFPSFIRMPVSVQWLYMQHHHACMYCQEYTPPQDEELTPELYEEVKRAAIEVAFYQPNKMDRATCIQETSKSRRL